MSRVRRILALTGALMVTGMIAGGLAAALGLALTALIRQDFRFMLDPTVWGFSALAGAAIGGILAPATSFLFLRHVPLGKLVVQTTVATSVLGGLGFALGLSPFVGAAIGYAAAATRLAIVTPRSKATPRVRGDDPPDQLGA